MISAQVDEIIKEISEAQNMQLEMSNERLYFGRCIVAQENELKNMSKKDLEERIKKIRRESLVHS